MKIDKMNTISSQASLPSETLKKLTCSNCKKPLSRFPIYMHFKFQHCICGRCVTGLTDLSDYTRNVAYEQIAEYTRFNCCHRPDGCLLLLFPTEMEDHEEKHCNYLKYDCALGKALCPWYGFHNEHLEHFRQNHEDFVLNRKQVTIDFNNSYEQRYLFINGEELFVVKIQNSLSLKKFSCVMYCIRKILNTENLYYKLEFSDLNDKFIVQILRKVNELYEVSDNGLSHTFCNDRIIHLRILHMEDLNKNNKGKEYRNGVNMAKPFECPICSAPLLAPIYQCKAGHSICKTCKINEECCLFCDADIGNCRNFLLENIVLDKVMSCENSNCTFTGKGSDVEKHQIWCDNRLVSCFFVDYSYKKLCYDSMKFCEIYNHMVSKHNSCLLKFDDSSKSFIITEHDSMFVLQYMSRLFRLLITPHDKLNTMCWSLQLIGNSEHCSQFKFAVNINFEETSRCLEGPCIAAQTSKEYLKNPKNFINSYVPFKDINKLCYPYSVTILDMEN